MNSPKHENYQKNIIIISFSETKAVSQFLFTTTTMMMMMEKMNKYYNGNNNNKEEIVNLFNVITTYILHLKDSLVIRKIGKE